MTQILLVSYFLHRILRIKSCLCDCVKTNIYDQRDDFDLIIIFFFSFLDGDFPFSHPMMFIFLNLFVFLECLVMLMTLILIIKF